MKQYRVNKAYGCYNKGDLVAPEGLWRDHLIMYDYIEKTPIEDAPAPAVPPVVEDIASDEPDPLVESDVIDEPEAAVLPEPETAAAPQPRRKKRGRYAY